MPVTGGVDLGGTKIQTAVVRGTRVLGKARRSTPQTGADAVVAAISEAMTDALTDAGLELAQLTAVGVGSPGSIDSATGEVSRSPNVHGMEDRFLLGPAVSRALGGKPVVVDNDVRAAMIGEHQAGAGRPFRDLLGVFVGTGVGGGLVLEGRLRTGRGSAGEIGHTVVQDKGRRCGCGRDGCLEAYAGRGSLERTARKLVAKGAKTVLFEEMEKRKRDRLTSGVFATALERGDKMAIELIDEAVWALGLALASAQNLLDLEAIIIGGGLGDRLGAPFITRIATSMQPHLLRDDRPPAMLPTELGDLSGAVGAALIASQNPTPLSGE
jgi:glucokinase